jgi:CheY-like chemotaxis protein
MSERKELNTKNACILHVEDDENDVLLLQDALDGAGVANPVQVATDGQQAIDYLVATARETDSRAHSLPCVMLLDLKLPVVSGFDVLRWARQRPDLVGLPVIILSSSEDPTDVLLAYKLGANSFVVKPFEREERVRLAQGINLWWIEHNLCPEASDNRRRGRRESLVASHCA